MSCSSTADKSKNKKRGSSTRDGSNGGAESAPTTVDDEDTDEDRAPKIENPYTVPVALLLYRVAKNLLANDEVSVGPGATRMSRKKASTIGTLLTNCVKLLDEEMHPGVG